MLGFGVFSLVKATISFDPRERSKLRDAVCVVGFYLAYIVLVGGDFKGTGRFLIPILAPLAFLAVTGTGNLSKDSRGGLFRGMITGACIGCALPGFEQMRAYAEHFARTWERQTAIAELLEAQGFPETEFQLAIHGAGIIPYYSGLRTLDLWGLNDAHIAQAESDDFGEGRAGHERSDYDYALSRRPLVILPEPLVALPYPQLASASTPASAQKSRPV